MKVLDDTLVNDILIYINWWRSKLLGVLPLSFGSLSRKGHTIRTFIVSSLICSQSFELVWNTNISFVFPIMYRANRWQNVNFNLKYNGLNSISYSHLHRGFSIYL